MLASAAVALLKFACGARTAVDDRNISRAQCLNVSLFSSQEKDLGTQNVVLDRLVDPGVVYNPRT